MSRGWSPLGERFGRNLWRTRRRAGLTQQELADLVGMHRGPLGDLERGLSLPRLDTILKLAAGTNVSTCVLLEGMDWRPAVASWVAVVQARKIAQEAREAEVEAMLPLLLVSLNFNLPGVGQPTMGVTLYNAGGSVAKNVAVLLIAEDAYARQIVGFLRPGETVTFGSELPATDAARAVAYAHSQDGRDLVWDHEGERRELNRPPSGWPAWEETFEVFYPGEDLSDHRPTNLLRGDDRLY